MLQYCNINYAFLTKLYRDCEQEDDEESDFVCCKGIQPASFMVLICHER